MEGRSRRLARLARLLENHKASLEARQAALGREARALDDRKADLLATLGGGIAGHDLFVDLLAGQMKRLEAESARVSAEAASLVPRIAADARRGRLVERAGREAGRAEERTREARDLAELLDRALLRPPASLPKG